MAAYYISWYTAKIRFLTAAAEYLLKKDSLHSFVDNSSAEKYTCFTKSDLPGAYDILWPMLLVFNIVTGVLGWCG